MWPFLRNRAPHQSENHYLATSDTTSLNKIPFVQILEIYFSFSNQTHRTTPPISTPPWCLQCNSQSTSPFTSWNEARVIFRADGGGARDPPSPLEMAQQGHCARHTLGNETPLLPDGCFQMGFKWPCPCARANLRDRTAPSFSDAADLWKEHSDHWELGATGVSSTRAHRPQWKLPFLAGKRKT